MLQSIGCRYVIVAHSERRQYFGESEPDVVRKTQAALEYNLNPIVCVGERLEERESGRTEEVLGEMFDGGIAPLTPEQFAKIVIAYEPVWAIGTGRTASADDAQAMSAVIRGELEVLGGGVSRSMLIQYGGSVTPDNAGELLACADVDGLLVGGASLDADKLVAIARSGAR
jgi:triosephosphate isomerase